MTVPDPSRPGEPSVYARLAEQQEERYRRRSPPGWAKPLGWLIVAAIVAGVATAVLEVHPW